MTEVAELTPKPSAYDAAAQVIEPFIAKAHESELGHLLDWFPMQEDQAELENADTESVATFTAEVLGNYTLWTDSVADLQIYRTNDGSITPAGDLGLTRAQANEIYPYTQEITERMKEYIYFLIDDLLGGDLAIVATELKSITQTLGFKTIVLQRNLKEDTGKAPNIQISFGDDPPSLESNKAEEFLESKPGDQPVDKVSFDQESNNLSIKFPKKVQSL